MPQVTFQQILIEARQDVFTDKVNALLMDGWRVVPGTFTIARTIQAADDRCPRGLVDNAGMAHWPKWFITLELTEERA